MQSTKQKHEMVSTDKKFAKDGQQLLRRGQKNGGHEDNNYGVQGPGRYSGNVYFRLSHKVRLLWVLGGFRIDGRAGGMWKGRDCRWCGYLAGPLWRPPALITGGWRWPLGAKMATSALRTTGGPPVLNSAVVVGEAPRWPVRISSRLPSH